MSEQTPAAPTPEVPPATPTPEVPAVTGPNSDVPVAATPEAATAAATPAAPASAETPSGDKRGPKKPFRGPKKPDRPKLDFTEVSTGLKLYELDAEIDNDLKAAMQDFDSNMMGDVEASKQAGISSKDAPSPSGRKKGRVVIIRGSDVFIDVPGSRSQGMMPIGQFASPPKVGDEVEFAIEGFDGSNGLLKLTKSGAAVVIDWSSVKIGDTVEARVTGTNKGGLSVEVNGIRGFMPIGQIDLYRVENAEQFVNQKLLCMVAEVEPSEKNLVVSRKALLEREREQQREQFWATLEVGQVLKGTIRSIQTFGAFVDLGAADGLLPISELSWMRVGKPEDVIKVGQAVEVKVLRLDPGARKITLSLKQLQQSPWETLGIHPGTRLEGRVTRITEFGAFVEIIPGVEGLLHVSELSMGRTNRIRDVVQENKMVEVQVMSIDKETKRISLSMKAIQESKRKAEADAAKAEMAARETAQEAEEEAIRPKKTFKFQLRGGK